MGDLITEKYNDDDYIIVEYDEERIGELVSEVNHLVSNGYKPVGGITARVGSRSGAYLLQAMIKIISS